MRIKLKENFRAIFYAPYYAAQALGLYAREGVEIALPQRQGDRIAEVQHGVLLGSVGEHGEWRMIKAQRGLQRVGGEGDVGEAIAGLRRAGDAGASACAARGRRLQQPGRVGCAGPAVSLSGADAGQFLQFVNQSSHRLGKLGHCVIG